MELRLLRTEVDEPGAHGEHAEIAVSVIVPVTERPQDLKNLYEEYSQVLEESGSRCEFLFAAEPWHRAIIEPLKTLPAFGDRLHVLQAPHPMGESALLRFAADRCRGPIILTLPAYRRVRATALPELISRVEAGAGVAAARRWPRRDSWINRSQGYLFNRLVSRLTWGQIRDVACGVTAMRREVFLQLPLYGDFFRFLPILALREGHRVEEVAAPQHDGDVSGRLYGPGVYMRRLVDILGLIFLLHFTEKPLRFFGLIGSALAVCGVAISGVLFVQRVSGRGIADRPLLLLGVLLLVLGIQAIALGLVGEIIVHLHASRRTGYRLAPDDSRP